MAKERTGYPTQKPVKLLERIILASSNKNDLVLDPFCGCATTCIAAERHERQWVGIDVSKKAHELVQKRLNREVAREGELFTLPVHFRERFLAKRRCSVPEIIWKTQNGGEKADVWRARRKMQRLQGPF